ncbi:hypothetical protein RMATCC62417_16815 [Rhizopus microsporus]|nr:hypothetical protein RMATCC62417_16815 [Rhizopus microsporus]
MSTIIPFNVPTAALRTQFSKLKAAAVHVDAIYKQGYMCYGILDFVTKTDNNLTMNLLVSSYDIWKEELSSNIIYEYVKGNLGKSGSTGDVEVLSKKAKGELRKDDPSYAHKRAALKLLKVHSQQQRNDINLLQSTTRNEYSFIIDYFRKIVTIIFDTNKNLWSYRWDETKFTASKEEKNLSKNDYERRSAGASIDGIVHAHELNLDLLVLEVSGPMLKEDYTHFLKDRLKIAKNMKRILKCLFRKSFILSEANKVDVFGLQAYRFYQI